MHQCIPVLFLITALLLGCSRDNSARIPQARITKTSFESHQASSASRGRIPIYVTPYYDSDGPTIDVGPMSSELKSLTPDGVDAFCERLKSEWTKLPVEVMYVLSIRLYDLGEKDRAVYWFYAATYRARLLKSLAAQPDRGRGFERIQAHIAFHTLAGEYINGYAFGDLEPLIVTIKSAKRDAEVLPDFESIYPDLQFVDREQWDGKNQQLAIGLDMLINYVSTNGEQIKSSREKNGIVDKY